MSAQVWLAAVLLLIGAVVGALGTAGLARANPTETIPSSSNRGWRRYVVSYVVELVAVVFAVVLLFGEVPFWVTVVALLAAVTPQVIFGAAHQRSVRRHRASH